MEKHKPGSGHKGHKERFMIIKLSKGWNVVNRPPAPLATPKRRWHGLPHAMGYPVNGHYFLPPVNGSASSIINWPLNSSSLSCFCVRITSLIFFLWLSFNCNYFLGFYPLNSINLLRVSLVDYSLVLVLPGGIYIAIHIWEPLTLYLFKYDISTFKQYQYTMFL